MAWKAFLVAVALITVACGTDDAEQRADSDIEVGGDAEVGPDRPTTSSTADPTTTPVPSTTLPTTSTVVAGDDPMGDAIALLAGQWSTFLLWGDGWVEIEVSASGGPIEPRDSDLGRLFPPEVYDAIEAAGATDMVAAYEALGSAGLLGEALAVFREHPEAWEAVFAGPGSLRFSASTTVDGEVWEERTLPFLSGGRLLESASTGDRLLLVFAPRTEGELAAEVVLVSTDDLETWTMQTYTPQQPTMGVTVVVEPLADGWLVLTGDGESGRFTDTYLLTDEALEELPGLPVDACCWLEATDAGILAYDGSWSGDEPGLAFSADGREWESRAVPAPDATIGAMAAVDGGIVMTTSHPERGEELWRGEPDGTGWEPVAVPDEIPWPVWVSDRHHRGIAQHIVPPGWGQRGYNPQPLVDYDFSVDHDGRRYHFAIAVGDDDLELTATVTDRGTGAVLYERSGPVTGADGAEFMARDGADRVLLDDSGAAAFAVPAELFDPVASEATEVAMTTYATPEEGAFAEGRYMLYSGDGRTWHSTILPPDEDGTGSFRQFVGSINGSRALLYWGEDDLRVVDLAAG